MSAVVPATRLEPASARKVPDKMLSLTIFGATLAYTALNLYLLAKIMPVPITLMPQTANYRSSARARVTP